MIRNEKLKEVQIPKKLAEVAFEAVKDLLKEYHVQQKFSVNSLQDFPKGGNYDLKWLAISCYTQGLSDAKQVLTENEVK